MIAFVLGLAAVNFILFMPKGNADVTAVITKDGKIFREIYLQNLQERIVIEDKDRHHILIEAECGRIHFVSSDCPDEVCVKTGWISKVGQSAACVPAGILIKIVGKSSDTDMLLK